MIFDERPRPMEKTASGVFYDIWKVPNRHEQPDGLGHFYRISEGEFGFDPSFHMDIGSVDNQINMVVKTPEVIAGVVESWMAWYPKDYGCVGAQLAMTVQNAMKLINQDISQANSGEGPKSLLADITLAVPNFDPDQEMEHLKGFIFPLLALSSEAAIEVEHLGEDAYCRGEKISVPLLKEGEVVLLPKSSATPSFNPLETHLHTDFRAPSEQAMSDWLEPDISPISRDNPIQYDPLSDVERYSRYKVKVGLNEMAWIQSS